MEKIKNLDIVAATLAASVTDKLDFGKESSNADLITYSTVKTFEDIYRQINKFNDEIK